MQYKGYNCAPEYIENKQMYYGTIEGLSGAPIIKAPSLESFEKGFQEAVDIALAKTSKKSRMRRIAIGGAALLLILALATVPGKDKHMNALSDDIIEIYLQELGKPSSWHGDAEIGAAKKLLPVIFDSRLDFTDCFLFSIGRWIRNDGKRFVSFGIFGHVFVIPNESLSKVLKGMYEDPNKPQFKAPLRLE